jgi:hypothetical protein
MENHPKPRPDMENHVKQALVRETKIGRESHSRPVLQYRNGYSSRTLAE